MRTLIEIIEGAKDGNKPPHDECYFAMLALEALSTFTTRDLRNVAFETREAKVLGAKMLAEEDHKRWQRALNAEPDKWLGPNHTPGTPEQKQGRRVANAIMARVMKDRESAEGE